MLIFEHLSIRIIWLRWSWCLFDFQLEQHQFGKIFLFGFLNQKLKLGKNALKIELLLLLLLPSKLLLMNLQNIYCYYVKKNVLKKKTLVFAIIISKHSIGLSIQNKPTHLSTHQYLFETVARKNLSKDDTTKVWKNLNSARYHQPMRTINVVKVTKRFHSIVCIRCKINVYCLVAFIRLPIFIILCLFI